MIAAQAIILTGFVSTAFTDVMIAAGALTFRSRRSGKDTTLIAKVKSAKRNPIPTPTIVRRLPSSVSKT
jgi:hypothetical protein